MFLNHMLGEPMKRFILLSLFVATSLLSSIKDIDLNIENLTPAQLKKVEELSEISKKIGAKQALINEWTEQIVYVLGMDNLDPKETEAQVNDFVKKFEATFKNKQAMQEILGKKLSVAEEHTLDVLKIFAVRLYFERLLMAQLVKQYKKSLLELSDLSAKTNK